MGDDVRVANAARVSFAKESEWSFREVHDFTLEPGGVSYAFETVLSEKDQKLIKYLATHDHFTPFTHVMITMRETVPIFVARQRFKHTIGFSYNEESRRYVSSDPTFFVPDVWRKAAENKKQGSSDETVEYSGGMSIDLLYKAQVGACNAMYKAFIEAGVAPEQARMVLPQSMYTSYYVTGSLAAWARAYRLRIDPHAQKEIQDLAKQWDDIISGIPEMKYSWEALTA